MNPLINDSSAHTEKAFRNAMRVTAASVSLLTCKDSLGAFHGLSVSSFSLFSMETPSMMVAIDRSSSVYTAILDTGSFCLNHLAESHTDYMDHLCDTVSHSETLPSSDWGIGANGVPYLKCAIASVFCDVSQCHDNYADQALFLGPVTQALADPDEERLPLIWLHGASLKLLPSFQETVR